MAVQNTSYTPRRRTHLRTIGCAVLIALFCTVATSSLAAEQEWAEDIWEALSKGKPTLNVRTRIEIAKATNLNRSEEYSIRTRLGYGTKPFHGVSAYMNFENIASLTGNTFFDPTRLPNSRRLTVIADPPGTEVNVGLLKIDRPDWLGTKVIGGRQAIVFDDARFIGDVIWRQNQQTYDAGYFQTTAGVDGLTARYGFIGHVNRIFGGGGNNLALQDFDSRSHIVNVSFTKIEQAKIVGFAYLLDLRLPAGANPSRFSNKSFGFRITGNIDLPGKFSTAYQGSYAYQSEFGGKTPAYDANYGLVDINLGYEGIGRVGGGFELLGSDNGRQQFLTPLSTAHKFNGWADVFLDNGGPAGLRDFYAYVAPQLPWKLKGRIIYHRFWADATGAVLGNEIDGVLTRKINEHVGLLFKAAYFDADPTTARRSIYRFWFDVTVKF